MEGAGAASAAAVYNREAALAELGRVEGHLHTLLDVYRQRLERGGGAAAAARAGVPDVAAALPELQHHSSAFLCAAKALEEHFAALSTASDTTGSAASLQAESNSPTRPPPQPDPPPDRLLAITVSTLEAELHAKDDLLARQAENLVSWQVRLSATFDRICTTIDGLCTMLSQSLYQT